MNQIAITVLEKQILHTWLTNNDHIVEDDIFISDIALSLQIAFLSLRDKGYIITSEHLLKEGVPLNDITEMISTSYQADKIEDYLRTLKKYKAFMALALPVKDLLDEVNRKDIPSLGEVKKINEKINNLLDGVDLHTETDFYTFSEALEEHIPTIDDRSKSVTQSTGCYMFDRIMPNVVPGLCTIGGYSGSMKTTFIQYISRQRLVKRLPTICVNTELAFSGYMDNFISPMIKEPYYDILGVTHDDNQVIDFSNIVDKCEKLKDKYETAKRFMLFKNSACSINDLEGFIKRARIEMNLDSKTTLFVLVDLMSMLSEFNESQSGYNKADSIEYGVNKINDLGLQNNALILGTVQLKRMPSKIKIEVLEDIDKFRPSLEGLKSSGAWEERSRWVILLHNPYHIVHKNPCSPIIKDLIDPILELTTLKDTYMGKTGDTIKYYFESLYKRLVPYEEEEVNE